VVAAVYSVSSSAPHLFEDRIGAFESDVRRLLGEVSPTGTFSQKTGDTEVRIWRPADDRGEAPALPGGASARRSGLASERPSTLATSIRRLRYDTTATTDG
jgi:hypothetical protein